MIALVAGEVAVRRPDHVVVETAGGVGYRLAVSAETLRHVPAVGKDVSLHAHTILRDPTNAEPITEIAAAVGVPSAAQFSRAFRERYGLSPRQLRAEHRARTPPGVSQGLPAADSSATP